ncbi:MAG: hypothetical protein ABR915_21290, partial [Thermoguttaceae bacterium]
MQFALTLAMGTAAVAYAVAGHYLLGEVPALRQRLLALGFIVLAMATYVLATRPRGFFSLEVLRRRRHDQHAASERHAPGRRTAQQRMIRIPGVGQIGLRPLGGMAVLLAAGGWWFTPWAPVHV